MSASQVASSEAPPHAAALDVLKIGEEEDDDDEEFEVYETIDDVPMKIQPGLFLGSCLAEGNLEALQQCGITHVLQVAEGMQPSHPETLQYQQVHVQDLPSEDLVAHFPKCFQHIDDALATPSGGVLVHCVAGVSRSATVVMGYLMWKERLSYDEAFRRVHTVRPWVMPNEGFRQQLREFERLGFDLSRWKAWRHTWKEDPLTLHLSSFATAEGDDVESAWDSLMR